MQTRQDQSPEASKAQAFIDVYGLPLTWDVSDALDCAPQPGHLTIATVPPGGLTVLGATIQHIEGESQADACHRLAAALMRRVAELRGLSVTLADDGALLALLPIAEESDG